MNDLQTVVDEQLEELGKSVADGKKLLADAISVYVTTASDATWEVLKTNMNSAFTSRYNAGVTAGKASPSFSSQTVYANHVPYNTTQTVTFSFAHKVLGITDMNSTNGNTYDRPSFPATISGNNVTIATNKGDTFGFYVTAVGY